MPKVTYSTQTPETISRIADDIDGLSAQLRTAAVDMERAGIKELEEVRSYSNLLRGLAGLESFIAAVRIATKTAREKRGDYRADEPDKKPDKTTREGTKRTP